MNIDWKETAKIGIIVVTVLGFWLGGYALYGKAMNTIRRIVREEIQKARKKTRI